LTGPLPNTALPAEPAGPSDTSGCPTPLVWDEVIRSVVGAAREATADVGDTRIQWLEFGSGRPLIVFPGATGTPRLFGLTAWLLREQYRCIMLGHPIWTKQPRAAEVIARTAELIGKILPSLAPQGAEAYAYGYGGQVALELLATTDAPVNHLILQGAFAHRPLPWREALVLRAGRFSKRTLHRVPLWLSVQLQNHRPWFPPYDESRFGFLLQETARTTASDAASRLLAASSTNVLPKLSRFRTPVTIIRTEGEGQILARAQEAIRQHLPPNAACREEWLHTSGHFPFVTHPHRLAKLIVQALQS
jgi:pimeloyl-ACP methyl ester carboxylesterase